MKKALMVAGALALASLTGASLAQENQDTTQQGQQAQGQTDGQQRAQARTPQQQAEIQNTLQTARGLADYAEANSDPLAFVTAAKMFASVQGKVLQEGQSGQEGQAVDIEGMLKKAEELSQGDELIAKVAADVRKTAEANSRWVCYWEWYGGYYYEVCYY